MAFFVCYGLFPFVYGLTRSGGLRPPQQAMRLRIDSVLLGAAEAGDLRYGAFRIA